MILDFQSKTCRFAVYKTYKMHEMAIAQIYVHNFNIKTRWSCFCGEKSISVPAATVFPSTMFKVYGLHNSETWV